MSIMNALHAAEAQSNELREEINGVIEGITASVQERVGGIANQIVHSRIFPASPRSEARR
jgi:hypothetical protein